ncbi:MAG: hypothetical protein LJE93_11040 [Acidobacteria bacterium]|nr:hypothetical protein [Acidobacteriota bacterium]
MSLINEALRKARQAASEHDQQQAQEASRPAKAYPSRRSGRPGGSLPTILIAVVAAAVGAAAAWWILGADQNSPTEVAHGAVQPAVQTPRIEAPEPSPTPNMEEPRPVVADTTVKPAPTPTTERVAVAGESQRPDSEATPPQPEPTTWETAKPRIGPDGERIFVMEADVGYATLSLGFIVARPDNPFAEINDTEVYVGSEINGFVVEAIEGDRVVLRDDNGVLVLQTP